MRRTIAGFWHAACYAFDRGFKTGRRRSEFEHKYRKYGDYFGYHVSKYALYEYELTLRTLLSYRNGADNALEIGCSVGVFTRMIAPEFTSVTAVDIAEEALNRAAAFVGDAGVVNYVRSDLVSLELDRTFDVIICAEVLIYVPELQADRVCKVLERHLSPKGVIIEVSPQDRLKDSKKFFNGWDRVLGSHFVKSHRQLVGDDTRPFEIIVYSRRS